MLFTDALETLALTADTLRDMRAKLEKYELVDDELITINEMSTKLAKHVAGEADAVVKYVNEIDSRVVTRRKVINRLKEATNILTSWIEYFEETSGNTHDHETWESLLSIAGIIASCVSSCDCDISGQINNEED